MVKVGESVNRSLAKTRQSGVGEPKLTPMARGIILAYGFMRRRLAAGWCWTVSKAKDGSEQLRLELP